MDIIRIGIITVSDRCSAKTAEDVSGNNLENYINNDWHAGKVIRRTCVPDECHIISDTLIKWSTGNEPCDVILTTGGTGFAERDVTPEATKLVINKEAPGFVVAMVQGSLLSTPMAMLSRPACGIRNKTIIINLPGSAKGSMENFQIIKSQLPHAVHLLKDDKPKVSAQHDSMQSQKIKTKVNAINVADRARKSPFPTIPVEKCQQMILEQCQFLGLEQKYLNNGLGYILAEHIEAKDPLPPFPASIKDGYAVKTSPNNINTLTVIGDSTAGEDPQKCTVNEKMCARVSTGAPVPMGADAVVQIEDTELVEKTEDGNDEKTIRLLKQPVVGQDIRKIGSDISVGQRVLLKGTKLGPTELGTLAAVGVDKFSVYRKPVIALLSTGNELQSPDSVLEPGKIRDSNKTTLKALFRKEGFSVVDCGIAKDDPQTLLDKLIECLTKSAIVVCTGGVSMGEKDYMKRALSTDLNATIHFGSVLMKPGKPTTFATCEFEGKTKLIFGLPGNPVSATVTTHLFVLPACRKLSGFPNPMYSVVHAMTDKAFKLDVTRPEYHRVNLIWNENSLPIARTTGNQISSRLLSCNSADALLCLPQGIKGEAEVVESGAKLSAILL